MNFNTVEEMLSSPYSWGANWNKEEKIYGRLSARAGMLPLPSTYHVAIPGIASPQMLVTEHYVGHVRGFFIADGIWWLLNQTNRYKSR